MAMLSVFSANVSVRHAVRRSSLAEAAERGAVSRRTIRGADSGAESKRLPGAAMRSRQVA
jgi:hypothetical protein